jgi:hypothetical protein
LTRPVQPGVPATGSPTICYFRNDDVNDLTTELIELSQFLIDRNIPVVQAVEPGNVTDECVEWLLEMKGKHGRLIEITQHGYNHTKYDQAEFESGRCGEDKFEDLRRGQEIMYNRFGESWFSALNFPYSAYDTFSVEALDELGFKVFSGFFNPKLSRRLFYKLGHRLNRGQLLNRNISYHLRTFPRTNLFTVDTVLDLIDNYHGHYGSQKCDWFSMASLIRRYEMARKHINVVGWLLHHRFHCNHEGNQLMLNVVETLQKREPDIQFWNLAEIHAAFANHPDD